MDKRVADCSWTAHRFLEGVSGFLVPALLNEHVTQGREDPGGCLPFEDWRWHQLEGFLVRLECAIKITGLGPGVSLLTHARYSRVCRVIEFTRTRRHFGTAGGR